MALGQEEASDLLGQEDTGHQDPEDGSVGVGALQVLHLDYLDLHHGEALDQLEGVIHIQNKLGDRQDQWGVELL